MTGRRGLRVGLGFYESDSIKGDRMKEEIKIKPLIYIAGPLSPKLEPSLSGEIQYLTNVRNMVKVAIKIFDYGAYPECPALDFIFFLLSDKPLPFTEEEIKNYSLVKLTKCDAVFLMSGWERSPGARREAAIAESLGLKLLFDFTDLKEFVEVWATKVFPDHQKAKAVGKREKKVLLEKHGEKS